MNYQKLLFITLFSALALAACAPTGDSPASNPSVDPPIKEQADAETSALPPAEEAAEPAAPPAPPADPGRIPRGVEAEFPLTDFTVHSVSYNEILSGGPPRDGIPPIDQPEFISIAEADEWLRPVEPVIQVAVNEEVRAYPIQILTWHEIVNDTVGGLPVVVTFCPLCNTAIAFGRVVNGQELTFGTTGRLRFSNLIMYDRQTETWWQQATGEGIVGSQTGVQLEFVPAAMVSWEEFKNANPDGLVLSRETGFNRSYGRNPYTGYDDVNNPPFLYQGPQTPGELPPVARVLALEFDGETVAYPYTLLSEISVVNDRVGEQEVAVFWAPGQASALDTSNIAEGQDVGSAVAYSRVLNDQLLSFRLEGGQILDNETGSTWDILGRAIAGPLNGEQLTEVVSVNHFWFSWAAFKPETRIYQP
ncbi:MAG: DUF3179 domain-containing protein [Brevefilum sp.]